MKNLPVCGSSNWLESVMLQPFSARKPATVATMPRVEGQATVRTYFFIWLSTKGRKAPDFFCVQISRGSGGSAPGRAARSGGKLLRLRQAVHPAAGCQRIRQKTGDGHRPNPTRHRSNSPRYLYGTVKVDIANQPRPAILFDPVDADIDHRGTRLDPIAVDHARPAHRRDQNIGRAAQLFDILCTAMGDGHGAACIQQQLRHRSEEHTSELQS